jgi:hypothetical protein
MFCKRFLDIVDSDIPVIATLGRMDVLDTLNLRNRQDITILTMTHKNRDSLWKTVLVEIARPAAYS